MVDETHSNAISYFKWVIVDNVGSWSYVGSQGPFYTKSETESIFATKEYAYCRLVLELGNSID